MGDHMSTISASTTTTTAYVVTADTTGALVLQTGATPTTAVTVDTSQNVGIGVTPSAWSSGKSVEVGYAGNSIWSGSAVNAAGIFSNAYYNGGYKYGANGYANLLGVGLTTGTFGWFTAPNNVSGAGAACTFTQAMTLDNSGNLLVGSSATYSGAEIMRLTRGGVNWFTGPNSTNGSFDVLKDGTTGVYLTSGATSWTGLSDETMKDIIEPITNASEKVASLRTVIGKYKTDEDGIRRAFLIAQDVQTVLPEAVNTNADGKLGLQYTDVIPLVVAAIKEQQALITQLQADVAALKGN